MQPNSIIHPNSTSCVAVFVSFHNKTFSRNINHCNLLLTITYSVACGDSTDPTRHFLLAITVFKTKCEFDFINFRGMLFSSNEMAGEAR